MHFSNKFYLKVLFLFIIIIQFSYRITSPVPDDSEEEAVPDEPPEEVSNDSVDSGGSPSLSQSAIDEYLREHPEAKSLINGRTNVKMKRTYNQYGDIVMVPDIEQLQAQKKQQAASGQLNQAQNMPYPSPQFNPHAQTPYYGQMMQQGMMAQGQGQFGQVHGPIHIPASQNGSANSETNSDENMDSKIDKLLTLAQSYPAMPDPAHPSNQSYPPLMAVSQMQSIPGMAQMQAMQSLPGMPAMQPILPMPGFVPMPGNPYYQVNQQGMQMIPMPFGNLVGMDPRLMKQLESGKAQLDMANAKIVPYGDGQAQEGETVPDQEGEESETLEDRPELPEVVIPKPKKKKRKHKKGKNGKPYFIMRARLKDLPRANQTGGDEWWHKPVPDYCFEEITEITDCKEKKPIEKRWSFNSEDEKCYLYEDQCFALKLNTFKSLKDCMTTCWRPKK